MAELIRLSESPGNKKVKIIKIEAGRGAKMKLRTLGLNIGSMVIIGRASRFKGPVLLLFNESEFAIGHGLAQKIFVQFV